MRVCVCGETLLWIQMGEPTYTCVYVHKHPFIVDTTSVSVYVRVRVVACVSIRPNTIVSTIQRSKITFVRQDLWASYVLSLLGLSVSIPPLPLCAYAKVGAPGRCRAVQRETTVVFRKHFPMVPSRLLDLRKTGHRLGCPRDPSSG